VRKGKPIVRYSAAELDAMAERGETFTDWRRVRAMRDRDVASDPAFSGFDLRPEALRRIAAALPDGRNKKIISMRVDADVLAWYRAGGPGYQRRMMAALRAYMMAANEDRATHAAPSGLNRRPRRQAA
jgi:uncharacterized protein (DUF4415 family)